MAGKQEVPAPSGSTTIKFESERYQTAPWIVAHGTVAEQRAFLIEAAGIDPESVADKSLFELAAHLSATAKGYNTAAARLASALPTIPTNGIKDTPAAADTPATAQPQDLGWDTPAASEPPFEGGTKIDPLVSAIETCTSLTDFAALYRDNKARFDEPEVKAAAAATQARLKKAA